MKYIYHPEEFVRAVSFVAKNNPTYNNDPEVASKTLNGLFQIVISSDNEIDWVCSGGFMVIKEQISKDKCLISVYINPATGIDYFDNYQQLAQ